MLRLGGLAVANQMRTTAVEKKIYSSLNFRLILTHWLNRKIWTQICTISELQWWSLLVLRFLSLTVCMFSISFWWISYLSTHTRDQLNTILYSSFLVLLLLLSFNVLPMNWTKSQFPKILLFMWFWLFWMNKMQVFQTRFITVICQSMLGMLPVNF